MIVLTAHEPEGSRGRVLAGADALRALANSTTDEFAGPAATYLYLGGNPEGGRIVVPPGDVVLTVQPAVVT